MTQAKTFAIDKLKFDDENANKGTARGRKLISRSLTKLGLGRSIVVDKNGRVIAGNKTLEAARKMGQKSVTVFETTGDELIAVMRTDLDLKRGKKARELAIADNRTSEIDLNWDAKILGDLKFDLDLGDWFNEKELRQAIGEEVEPKQLFSSSQVEKQIVADWPNPKDADELVRAFMCESLAMTEFNKLAGGGRAGYYISALFNSHRFTTRANGVNGRTFFDGLKDAEHKRIGARFMVKFHHETHPNHFVKISGVGWGGAGQLCYEFRPEIARDLYLRYCKRGAKVLDPCHGWGGRVVGWLAADLGGQYIGYDPSTRTNEGVKALIAFLAKSKTRSKAKALRLPFEDAPLQPNSFDFALTSPPYYDTEKYSDEDTNSLNRYESFDKWVDGFYRPLICKTLINLKRGKPFVLNIGNKVYPLSKTAAEIAKSVDAKCERLEDYVIGRPDDVGGEEKSETIEEFLAITKP